MTAGVVGFALAIYDVFARSRAEPDPLMMGILDILRKDLNGNFQRPRDSVNVGTIWTAGMLGHGGPLIGRAVHGPDSGRFLESLASAMLQAIRTLVWSAVRNTANRALLLARVILDLAGHLPELFIGMRQ
jgi:hypothetical protein